MYVTFNQQGMLKYLGYQVGVSRGECPVTRRHILDSIFDSELPPVNSPEYMQGWHSPKSAARLQRLATELARFARSARAKGSSSLEVAIDEWEEDLAYLYETYYKRKFGFAWPSSQGTRPTY